MSGIDKKDEDLVETKGEQKIPLSEPLSVAIPRIVAENLECDPVDLSDHLHDVVDAEALDTAFSGANLIGSLSFIYCHHIVTVYPDRSITVHDDISLTKL